MQIHIIHFLKGLLLSALAQISSRYCGLFNKTTFEFSQERCAGCDGTVSIFPQGRQEILHHFPPHVFTLTYTMRSGVCERLYATCCLVSLLWYVFGAVFPPCAVLCVRWVSSRNPELLQFSFRFDTQHIAVHTRQLVLLVFFGEAHRCLCGAEFLQSAYK